MVVFDYVCLLVRIGFGWLGFSKKLVKDVCEIST